MQVGPSHGAKAPGLAVYRRRWLVLTLMVLYSASNAFQWLQYSIVADIVMKYYSIESSFVDWTSMVFMVMYIVLVIPGSYFLDKKGLRWSVILGALGSCLGAWIKVFGLSPGRFWAAFLGQTVAATAQIFVLAVPVKLAAVWFGPDQVSTACSVGVFGNQIGVALSMFVIPLTVRMHENEDDIGQDLTVLAYVLAGATTVIFVLVLFFFTEKPPTPPSLAQQKFIESGDGEKPFLTSLKSMVSNRALMLMLLTYGSCGGVINALTTLLNQIMTLNYPGSEEDVGYIGMIIFLFGFLGAVLTGIVLDKTKKYKETILFVYAGCLATSILFTFVIHLNIIYVYVCGGFLGFFMLTFISIGFEFAAELSYPEPETTVGGLITASLQLFSIAFTLLYSKLFYAYSDYVANAVMCVLELAGVVLTMFVKNDLRRQNALRT